MNFEEIRLQFSLSNREIENAIKQGLIVEKNGAFIVVDDIKLRLEQETLISSDKAAQILNISPEDFLGFVRILMISPVAFGPDLYRRGDIESVYDLVEDFLGNDKAVSQYEIDLAATENFKLLSRIALQKTNVDGLLYWIYLAEGHLTAYQHRMSMTHHLFLKTYYHKTVKQLEKARSKAAMNLIVNPNENLSMKLIDKSTRTACSDCMVDFDYKDCNKCLFNHSGSLLELKVKGDVIEYIFSIPYQEVVLWPGDDFPSLQGYWAPFEDDITVSKPPGFDEKVWNTLDLAEQIKQARSYVLEQRNITMIGSGDSGLTSWLAALPRSSKHVERMSTPLALRSLFPAGKVIETLTRKADDQ